MSLPEFSNSQRLQEILIAEIESSPTRQITFSRYMELVLYHEQYGYYNSTVKIGSQGDFFTSASLGRDFGELLALQLEQMWRNLGCPNPFSLVEMGAGNGELAQDILNYIRISGDRDFGRAINYIIIEQSSALIEQQQLLLESFSDFNLVWQDWSELPLDGIVGCFFSNELLDAFPVHLIQKAGQLQEVYLSSQNNKLTETVDVFSTERIRDYFIRLNLDLSLPKYPEGYRTEVNLQALDWLEKVASKLQRGYLLTIDYGYSADKYYLPSRDRGTLQCYYQHRRHNNPYANLGRQDLTAHVNFTALKLYGTQLGLDQIGLTQQGLFLMALGLGDRLNELSSGSFSVSEIFKRRDALHQLIDPVGLGGHKILIQGKNLSESERQLQGLTEPDY